MTEGKLSAQVAHAVKNLGFTPLDCDIIVLGVSDKKFEDESYRILVEFTKAPNDWFKCYTQIDKGLTEIPEGTRTTFAYIEKQ